MLLLMIWPLASFAQAGSEPPVAGLDFGNLRNPVWVSKDNLRDPSVLKVKDGYLVFYSRFSGEANTWNKRENWAIACVFTRDFVHFENDRDVSPKGCASPGDVIFWHGRYVLPYQTYPDNPSHLCYSESADLQTWSTPKGFLPEANKLPWNNLGRAIDPSFVLDGDTLHCFFVGSTKLPNPPGGKANLIGHAITRDPKLEKWEILSKDAPIIGISNRAPDGAENTMVFKTGDHWTMIFSEGLTNQHLALATSKDLRDWKIEGPIEIARQKWCSHIYGAPFVWREDSQWVMILMGTNAGRTTFGLLTSPDGEHWSQLPE